VSPETLEAEKFFMNLNNNKINEREVERKNVIKAIMKKR